jgi:YkoY family integral membrane protein
MEAADLFILLNLVILESLLSIDNAAVLAVMVKDLPRDQQPKALKYGLAGAFFFRGLALVLAAWLVEIVWLKIAGGAYLLYLGYAHFTPKRDSIEEGVDKEHNKFYLRIKNWIGPFWSTVLLVEIMDIAFSIDNVFAAVAMTDKLWLIVTGVCIGILAMRFVATRFATLLHKHPALENSAFVVIILLGLKLVIGGATDYNVLPGVKAVLESHWFDLAFSAAMVGIFFVPFAIDYFKKPEHG